MRQIEISYRWKKPAVITTHRINYVGGMSEKNRDRGLHLLEKLLTKILKKWSDVEFMTSDQLGKLIEGKEG